MSLAEELALDIEEIGDLAAIKEEEEDLKQENPQEFKYEETDTIHKYAKLLNSEQLSAIVSQIDRVEQTHSNLSRDHNDVIIAANNTVFEIENELDVVVRFVRAKYNRRFPELEQLVPSPGEYMRTVQMLGNMPEKVNWDLFRDFLSSATIMVVSVSASNTQGSPLTEEVMDLVMEACQMSGELLTLQDRISHFVQSRMQFVAPNLSAIVGSLIAAKLMGVAGGLEKLAVIPACNVSLLGSRKKSLAGYSTRSLNQHLGYVYFCDVVQSQPQDSRMVAGRIVSSKIVLAARVDFLGETTDGSYGQQLLKNINYRLGLRHQAPQVKAVKPLPAPIDHRRKRRGGRRARKVKARLGITELRKQTQRVTFGKIATDAYVEDVYNVPSVSGTTSGRIRMAAVDPNSGNRLSKTTQTKLARQRNQTAGVSSTIGKQIAGTASSFVFTPMQGLEIVNPNAAEKQNNDDLKYFGAASTFTSIKRS